MKVEDIQPETGWTADPDQRCSISVFVKKFTLERFGFGALAMHRTKTEA
jgi:hypothetical protein